jgi:hypothetical protein
MSVKNSKQFTEEGNLTCSKCKQDKPVSAFSKNKKQTTGYNYACKLCMKQQTRRYNLPAKYGITVERYIEKIKEQDYKCACCGVKFNLDDETKKAPCVDHNHTTGEVRDILCHRCNLAAGNVLDSSEQAEKLAAYLRKWNC